MADSSMAEDIERLTVLLKCMEGENAGKPGPCPGPNADRPTRREPAPAHVKAHFARLEAQHGRTKALDILAAGLASVSPGDAVAAPLVAAAEYYLQLAEYKRHAPTVTKALQPLDLRQEDNWDCGPTALETAARAFGINADHDELVQLLDASPDSGTAPEALAAGAEALGLLADAHAGMTIDDLRAVTDAGGLVICAVQMTGDGAGERQGHYVTVYEVREDDGAVSVYVQDPSQGPKRIGRKLFLRRWHDVGADGTEYERWGLAVSAPGGQKAARPVRKSASAEDASGDADSDPVATAELIADVLGGLLGEDALAAFEESAAEEEGEPEDKALAVLVRKCLEGENAGKPGPCPTGHAEQDNVPSKVQAALARNPRVAFRLLDRAELNWHHRSEEDREALVVALSQAPARKIEAELSKAQEEWASYLRLHGREAGQKPQDYGADHPGKPFADYILSKYDLLGEALARKQREESPGSKSFGGIPKAWDALQHPRGAHGRFIPKGSAEAVSAAKAGIDEIRKLGAEGKSPEHAKKLAQHLSILTVKQLHELKKEYGLKASGKLREQLVAKLLDRLPGAQARIDAERKEAAKQLGLPAEATMRDIVEHVAVEAGYPEHFISKQELEEKLDELGVSVPVQRGEAVRAAFEVLREGVREKPKGKPAESDRKLDTQIADALQDPQSSLRARSNPEAISVAALRQANPGMSRQQFDDAVLHLWRAGKIGIEGFSDWSVMPKDEIEGGIPTDTGTPLTYIYPKAKREPQEEKPAENSGKNPQSLLVKLADALDVSLDAFRPPHTV